MMPAHQFSQTPMIQLDRLPVDRTAAEPPARGLHPTADERNAIACLQVLRLVPRFLFNWELLSGIRSQASQPEAFPWFLLGASTMRLAASLQVAPSHGALLTLQKRVV